MSRLAKRRAVSASIGAAVIALGVWSLSRLDVTSDVTRFLPTTHEDAELGLLSALLSDTALTRTWIVSVGAPSPDEAVAASAHLERRLRRHAQVEALRSGSAPGLEEAVRALYLPRAALFVGDGGARAPTGEGGPRGDARSDDPRSDDPLSDDALRAAARELARRLGLPTGGLERATAPFDPLLTFPDRIERLRRAAGDELRLREGRFVSRDGRHAFLFLRTRAPAFDTRANAGLARAIERAFAEANARAGGTLTLEHSSIHRIALHSEAVIRADVTRISVASSLAIVLLFLWLFRSPWHLLAISFPVAVGVAAALSVSTLAFGELHGLTLAFGATLIGVCVDYAIHLVGHHAIGDGDEARTLARAWPGILIGGLTTVAGLSGLALTAFPGLREMAFFASAGVAAALLATRYLLPPWLPRGPAPPTFARLSRGLAALYESLGRRRTLLLVAWAASLLVGVVGLGQTEWQSSLRALGHVDPALLAEDERVRARVSRMDGSRLVASVAEDLEGALQINDAVHGALARARAEGDLEAFRSLHDFLPSEASQRESLAALRAAPELRERLDRAFVAEGFVEGAFEPFLESIAEPAAPLRFEDVAASPLGEAIAPFRVELGARVAVLTLVRGVRDPSALAVRLEAIEGARFVDQDAILTAAYDRYRHETLAMVVAGLAAVLLLLLVRYRSATLALAAFLPAALAALATLGLLGLVGMKANLMHLVALLLVLSMGVDYGVFVVEHRDSRAHFGATLGSLCAACATTVLSFGLLGMSENPALRALGISMAVGVLMALWLAPASLLIAGGRR